MWNSDYPNTHHNLPRGTQTIPILFTVSLVVLRLSLYTSQSQWCYSDYPFTQQSLPGGSDYPYTHHSHPDFVLDYPSQSTWWYSDYPYTHQSLPGVTQTDYPYTHHSLPGGTHTIPILSKVSLVVVRLSLYPSQSPWWHSDYP